MLTFCFHILIKLLLYNTGICELQILAMIEEAAGTRMYECKKQLAQKTIEKKDAKLKELNTVWQWSFMLGKKVMAPT